MSSAKSRSGNNFAGWVCKTVVISVFYRTKSSTIVNKKGAKVSP